jgi:uncharacterized MnhB-related membrane protein
MNDVAVVDVAIAVGLLGLTWWLVTPGALLRMAVLFVAMGVVMSLAWVRLLAFDVALVEAAVTTGFMGMLIVDAAVKMGGYLEDRSPDDEGAGGPG